jgi:hypothetical protein
MDINIEKINFLFINKLFMKFNRLIKIDLKGTKLQFV